MIPGPRHSRLIYPRHSQLLEMIIVLRAMEVTVYEGIELFCCRVRSVEWLSLRPLPLRGGVREDQSVPPPLAATRATWRQQQQQVSGAIGDTSIAYAVHKK
jgi:hypothetical protein